MTDANAAKKRAAAEAVAELPEAGVIGLGTGSTAYWFVEEVAKLVKSGRDLRGVCTSEATRAHASGLGIPLLDDDGPWAIDVTVDGADEVADDLSLSKGAGGALTREKIVAHASKRLVIVCDASKRVALLGATRPISVEILRFGHATTLSSLAAHGKASLRRHGGGLAVTDAGNYLVDLMLPVPLTAPGVLDRELRSIPGVVETGLFLGRAALVLIAHDDGRVERLER